MVQFRRFLPTQSPRLAPASAGSPSLSIEEDIASWPVVPSGSGLYVPARYAEPITADDEIVPSGGGFLTPDLANNIDFETDFAPFTAWSSTSPPTGVTRSNVTAKHGSWSMLRTFVASGSDTGSSCEFNLRGPGTDQNLTAGFDRIWTRLYFNISGQITTHWKYWRFYDSAGFTTPLGGLWIDQAGPGFSIVFDDAASISYWMGGTNVFDGTWHWVEMDYMMNGTGADGSTWQNAAIWVDGTQIFRPDGTSTGGAAYWKGGRLYAGDRSTSTQLGNIEVMGTLNGGNTLSGTAYMDMVSISSLGRIGP